MIKKLRKRQRSEGLWSHKERERKIRAFIVFHHILDISVVNSDVAKMA
jgi:hypothetical protein